MTRASIRPKKNSKEYEFTLLLAEIKELTPAALDALYEAGCDDATFGSQGRRIYATFTRRAMSLKDAVLSAIRDVRNAGVEVRRVDDDDLVSPSEIARRIERSRQLVHQYVTGERGPGDFPPPAARVKERAPLWSWSEVALWLAANGLEEHEAADDGLELVFINTVLDLLQQQKINPKLAREVAKLVGAG
jgi:hypothetical protein